jgi:ADP-ribosylglycohydrolase
MTTTLAARFRACLLGLALGDALGTTVEFAPPGSFEPLTDLVGGGPFGLQAGQWTDDTSMALCLAESLVACQGFDAVDQLRRYVRWWREGYWSSTGVCFDIGGAVRQALQRFERTGEPYCGSTDPYTAGNGSLMRLAPAVLAYANQPAAAIERAAESSRTTHQAPAAIDACRYYAALLLGALAGVEKAALLAEQYCPLPDYWPAHPLAPEIAAVAGGSFKRKQPPELRGTGYVVQSLEAALWAFYRSRSFEEGCLLAANLGDDADTTAAIYGQLAGAYYGLEGLPERWLGKLAMRAEIEALADRLYALSQAEKDCSRW